MKLAVIILLLTICYCGSASSQDRCSCLQNVPDNLSNFDLVQPRTRRDEQVQESLNALNDPALFEVENRKGKTPLSFGSRSKVPPRGRRGYPDLSPDMIRLLREYKQQPEYIAG